MNGNKVKSIFRLEEIRGYELDGHLYRDAGVGILGHYLSMEKAMEAMAKKGSEAWDAEEIMAYMVKEIAVDGELREVDWLSVRTYDAQGVLIDECLHDYNLCNQFEGRNPEAIRFKIGDIVKVLEGHRFFTAIVAALPPTPEDHFPVLDAIDDCYLVLPLDAGGLDHLHVAPTHTFVLQHSLEKRSLDYLRNRLLNYQDRKFSILFAVIIS